MRAGFAAADPKASGRWTRSSWTTSAAFSFYNDQGFSHIVNQDGDILLRPTSITQNLYDNIFDSLSETQSQQEEIDRFMKALRNRETGSMIFSKDNCELVYTYVPVEDEEGWFLFSAVSLNAIKEETD